MARRGDTIELAVLGLLHEGPMHGYELRKRLNLMLGWGRVLSYGSLYPALKKMLRANLIEEVAATTTPISRRPRIVYEVTAAGNEQFQRLMSEVGPDRVGGRQLRHPVRVLRSHRHGDPAAGPRRAPYPAPGATGPRPGASCERTQAEVNSYAAELQRHGVESVEREVRWLSDLIPPNAASRGRPAPPATEPTHQHRPTRAPTTSKHQQRRRAPWVPYE